MYLFILIFAASILYWFAIRIPFLQAQETAWYSRLLEPVIEAILADKRNKNVLDIGSGNPGGNIIVLTPS